MTIDLDTRIAARLSLPAEKVAAARALLDGGATVPFVARYRKERTGGLDEVQIRDIARLHEQIVELEERRGSVRETLRELGKLSPELERALDACETRGDVEDLYAPYKKRRKTRADTAREQGLEPLAQRILAQPTTGDPEAEARRFVDAGKGVADTKAALAGASDIVAETLASDPVHVAGVRRVMREQGVVSTTIRKGAEGADKFRDYADYQEPIGRIPSHRYLAVCRGEAEDVLSVKVRPDVDRTLQMFLRSLRFFPKSPYGPILEGAAEDALKRLLLPAAERSVRAERKAAADDEAIDVFERNLEALLLSAPLGARAVLGVDPGIRTGCKCALVSATGALTDHRTLQLVGRANPERAPLADWLRKARPDAVAVGNGTGGREALDVVREAVREAGVEVVVVSVSESGASIYSASDLAREELPDVDLTVRGAVHIARRLQDPLAELVKVPPQSIGVGQYQHDVDQGKLGARLADTVESCVNRVGVDANTASPALLAYVAGIGPKLASAVVAHREKIGGFPSRRALLEVAGLGPKTFEQCAGFLRVRGTNPLDASGVHPERYTLVAKMAKDLGVPVGSLVGDATAVARIDLRKYEDPDTGRATLTDIAAELAKPGRDPRDQFEAPEFRDDVREIGDLEVGMVLEGVVTNVTNFGAFVDIGVHQDGLVHVSQLSDRFVRSPHEVVTAGQRLTVKVLSVDAERRRISLTAKSG